MKPDLGGRVDILVFVDNGLAVQVPDRTHLATILLGPLRSILTSGPRDRRGWRSDRCGTGLNSPVQRKVQNADRQTDRQSFLRFIIAPFLQGTVSRDNWVTQSRYPQVRLNFASKNVNKKVQANSLFHSSTPEGRLLTGFRVGIGTLTRIQGRPRRRFYRPAGAFFFFLGG